MNEKVIYILTGKIKSGKTTSLFNFVAKQKSIDGILTPVIDNKRYFYHISSKVIKNVEADKIDEEVFRVGKYKFLSSSFNWANKRILHALENKNDWIVIDEIGPLELEGNGFHNSVIKLLKEATKGLKIIFVVRESLVEKFLNYYQLDKKDIEFLNLSGS